MLWCCCCVYLCCCCWCCQVLTLAGELLGNAEVLLRDGLHTSEIADGYQRASDKVCGAGAGTPQDLIPAQTACKAAEGKLGDLEVHACCGFTWEQR